MLNRLKSTSSGPDELPFWFLKILAPSICKPLSFLFNLSIFSSTVPTQWKQAVISPIPKIASPSVCSDFRPISLTPIVSRMLEKLIVRNYIYPAISTPVVYDNFADQFAYRPTGSTEAALISILHHATILLRTHEYARVIALDFSKAFDTIRHSTVAEKLAVLPLPDEIYNWFIDRFDGHKHTTKFQGDMSNELFINASVFQDSAIGPALFALASTDLKPVYSDNYIDKYADDSYLIVGADNDFTVTQELKSIDEWAERNNMKLNRSKTTEIVFHRSPKIANPPQNVGIGRVDGITILGVTFD